MYITLSWVPVNGTSTADVLDDLDHAMPSSDFDMIFDPFPGLRLAVVVGGNQKHVSDLHQTLIPMAASRFDYVIAHIRKGNFMLVSTGVDGVVCEAIANA
jgi:hypothetical protein